MYGAIAMLAFLQAQTGTTPIPPPPVTRIEILRATPQTHSVEPRCGTRPSLVRWFYDGEVARISDFTFNGMAAKPADLAVINAHVVTLRSDLLARVDCSADGATVTFFTSLSAGTPQVRRMTYDIDARGIRLVDANF